MLGSEILHLPLEGGATDQPMWMMDGLEAARRVWVIEFYKPRNHISPTPEDIDYMAKVLKKDE